MGNEIATFGAGCFWHVQAEFDKLDGVVSTEVGYAGGKSENVTYEQVCDGGTGHAEVCRVEYDPTQLSYEDLLKAFWGMHDPTTMNRQGPDVGYQYRSVIFYHTPQQKEIAEASKMDLDASDAFSDPIVTAIEEAGTYCRAEEYHQKYFKKTGKNTCAV